MHTEDMAWNFVSFYYSRNNWHLLVQELLEFRNNHEKEILYFLITFSEKKGENVRLTMSSSKKNHGLLRYAINNQLDFWIKNNLSTLSCPFPYGESMWINYDNNTIVWDTFRIDFNLETERKCIQLALNVVLRLLDGNFSQDSFLSTGIYLFIQIIKSNDLINLDNILSDTENSISMLFHNVELADTIDKLIKQYNVDDNQIFEIMDSYWQDDNSLILHEWLSSIKVFGDSGTIFREATNQLFNIMGLNRMHHMLIIELIKRWNRNRA